MKEKRTKQKDKEFLDWWNIEGSEQFNNDFINDHIAWEVLAVNGMGSQLDVTGKFPDPLDCKPILNAYGERLHYLNGIVKVYQRKLNKQQIKFTGLNCEWIYEITV